MGLIAAFGPIWTLTVAGYLARRWRLLAENGALVLGQFLFHIAIPAALFVTLAKTPLSGFAPRPLVAFGASTAIVIGAGWYGAGRWFGRKLGERAIWGMAAGYVNSANLGIPIALRVLGNLSFLIEVVVLQVLIVTPMILIVLDRHDDTAGRVRLRRIATLPVRNPVILASALCAGLPTAQNTFVYAQHYRTGETLAARAVLVTTTLSMATLAATAALLHGR